MAQVNIQSPFIKAARLNERIRYICERFGEGHLYFAYHAAFPLALTPDLLYRLWANFQRDIHGEVLNIPWIAVADLLFSALCEEVGHELYEMNKAVRAQLLNELKAHPRFGNQRMQELTEFILSEAQQELDSSDIDVRDLAQAQRWTALVYTRTKEAAHELALTLAKLSLDDTSEWARMTSLIESLEDPLKEGQFEDLVTYIRGMYHFIRDEYDQAVKIFDKLPAHNQRIEIAGVNISIPKIETEEKEELISFLTLRVFEFNVAQIQSNSRAGLGGYSLNIIKRCNSAKYFLEDLDIGLDLEMISIPSGKFQADSSSKKQQEVLEYQRYSVTVPSFFMSKYPITQMQWRIVAGLPKVSIDLKPNPSYFAGPHRPVESISWYEAIEFCERLHKQTDKLYRLPNEAEWEYACRAGTATPFHFGETIDSKLARISDGYNTGQNESLKGTTVVGYFKVANNFGLYDMHGNVQEWCTDQWNEDYSQVDQSRLQQANPNRYQRRVVRGGSWSTLSNDCQSASRDGFKSSLASNQVGFRVAVSFLNSS